MEKTLSVISHDNTKIYRSALETYSYFSSMRFQKKVDNNLLKILLSTYPGIRNYCRVTSDLSLANQTTDLKDYQLVPNKKLYIDYPFLLMSMNPKQGRSLTEINPKRSIFRLLRHIKAPSLNVSQSLNPHNSWLLLRFVSIETSKSSTLLRPQREKFFMIGQTALT